MMYTGFMLAGWPKRETRRHQGRSAARSDWNSNNRTKGVFSETWPTMIKAPGIF